MLILQFCRGVNYAIYGISKQKKDFTFNFVLKLAKNCQTFWSLQYFAETNNKILQRKFCVVVVKTIALLFFLLLYICEYSMYFGLAFLLKGAFDGFVKELDHTGDHKQT